MPPAILAPVPPCPALETAARPSQGRRLRGSANAQQDEEDYDDEEGDNDEYGDEEEGDDDEEYDDEDGDGEDGDGPAAAAGTRTDHRKVLKDFYEVS